MIYHVFWTVGWIYFWNDFIVQTLFPWLGKELFSNTIIILIKKTMRGTEKFSGQSSTWKKEKENQSDAGKLIGQRTFKKPLIIFTRHKKIHFFIYNNSIYSSIESVSVALQCTKHVILCFYLDLQGQTSLIFAYINPKYVQIK